MLGPRIDSLSLGRAIDGLRLRLGLRSRAAAAAASASRWERVARFVMRYPVPVLVPTLAFLLLLGLPFLRIQQGVLTAAMPPGAGDRDAVAIEPTSRAAETPIVVLAETGVDRAPPPRPPHWPAMPRSRP
jgi:RND superfamily putative drug exporter